MIEWKVGAAAVGKAKICYYYLYPYICVQSFLKAFFGVCSSQLSAARGCGPFRYFVDPPGSSEFVYYSFLDVELCKKTNSLPVQSTRYRYNLH